MWITLTLCDESFMEGGYREEEDANVDDNGGPATKASSRPMLLNLTQQGFCTLLR